MQEFTLADLNRAVNTCEGVEMEITEADMEVTFAELDIDSLTLVELAERLASSHGIPVPTEIIEDFRTPKLALDYVNGHLGRQREERK